MIITHIAIWTYDLETMKDFYMHYFGGKSNEKYINPVKKFASYFITFDSGAKLELMHRESMTKSLYTENRYGIAHIAFALGSEAAVLSLTERLRTDGIRIIGEPRTSGDGYFESVILDLEGNRIELLA